LYDIRNTNIFLLLDSHFQCPFIFLSMHTRQSHELRSHKRGKALTHTSASSSSNWIKALAM
jgi:hypothetical protein